MALETATGTFNTGTGGVGTTVSVTELSFQPKVVIFCWSGRTSAGQAEGDHKFGMGYMISATDRGGSTSQSDHGVGTSVTDGQTFDDAAIKLLTIGGAVDGAADFDAMLSNGFRVIIDDVFVADYLTSWLAIGGSDLTDVISTTLSSLQTIGDQDINVGLDLNTGLDDKAVIFFGGSFPTINTTSVGSDFNLGVAAGNAIVNAVLHAMSVDAAGTSDTNSYARNGDCIVTLNSASNDTRRRASLTAWLSTGFRLNWAKVNTGARVFRALVLKGGRYQVGDALTSTGTTNQTEATSYVPKALLIGSHNNAASTIDVTQAPDERSVGFATSPTARNYCSVIDKDSAGTMDIGVAQNTDAMYANQSTDATVVIEGLMDLVSFDSPPGFTYVMDDADPAQSFFWYLLFADAPSAGGFARPRIHPMSGPRFRFAPDRLSIPQGVPASLAQQYLSALAGVLSFVGSEVPRTGKVLTGTLSFAGVLIKAGRKVVAATLSFVGAIAKRTIRALVDASLSFAGSLKKGAGKAISGSLSFVGVVSRRTSRPLAASLSFAGAVVRATSRALVTGTLSFSGAVSKITSRGVSGALSFVGAISKTARRSMSGTLSFVGSSTRAILKVLAGTLSFAGVASRIVARAVVGTLSFVGLLAKNTGRSLAGALSFVGSFGAKSIFTKALTATLSFVGATSRQTGKALSAQLSFVGLASRLVLRGLSASLSFVGAVSKRTVRGLGGGLSFVGSLLADLLGHLYMQALAGTVSFVGVVSKQTARVSAGTLSFVGAIRKQTGKAFPGTLSFTGALVRASRKALSASLDFAGVLAKASKRALAATLSFVGAFIGSHLILKAFTAALSFTGVMTKQAGKAVVGSLSLSGILSRRIGKVLTASLSLAGVLALLPTLQQLFTAVARVGQFFSTMLSSSKAGTTLTDSNAKTTLGGSETTDTLIGSETKTTVKDSKV